MSLFVHPDRDDVQVPSSGIFVQEDDVRLVAVPHALHELMSDVGHLSVGKVILRCRRERKMDDRFTDVGITVGKEPESVEAVGKVDAAVRLAGKALRSQHLALAGLGLQIVVGKHSVEVAAVAHGGNHARFIFSVLMFSCWGFLPFLSQLCRKISFWSSRCHFIFYTAKGLTLNISKSILRRRPMYKANAVPPARLNFVAEKDLHKAPSRVQALCP